MSRASQSYTVRLYTCRAAGTLRSEAIDFHLSGDAGEAVAFGKAQLEWVAKNLRRGGKATTVESARVLDERGTDIAHFQVDPFGSRVVPGALPEVQRG